MPKRFSLDQPNHEQTSDLTILKAEEVESIGLWSVPIAMRRGRNFRPIVILADPSYTIRTPARGSYCYGSNNPDHTNRQAVRPISVYTTIAQWGSLTGSWPND